MQLHFLDHVHSNYRKLNFKLCLRKDTRRTKAPDAQSIEGFVPKKKFKTFLQVIDEDNFRGSQVDLIPNPILIRPNPSSHSHTLKEKSLIPLPCDLRSPLRSLPQAKKRRKKIAKKKQKQRGTNCYLKGGATVDRRRDGPHNRDDRRRPPQEHRETHCRGALHDTRDRSWRTNRDGLRNASPSDKKLISAGNGLSYGGWARLRR